MSDLKNCPDCDSKAVHEKYERFGEGDFIECSNDDCNTIVFGRDLPEAVKGWNELI